MPQTHRVRGRRADKKRKREEEGIGSTLERSTYNFANDVETAVEGPQLHREITERPPDIQFYGMLDDDEQEYFKRADSMLELNQFANPEERDLFLASVYKEARGKELKIANSQSCSRLLERLICISTPSQLKTLFQKFTGHFLNLSQHRFASHCCEALFIESAPIVSQELTAPSDDQNQPGEEEAYVTMENLFLFALNELQEHLGFLMTNSFASHTLRVLLLVFSGHSVGDTSVTSTVRSRKKENITVPERGSPWFGSDGLKTSLRTVPDSFGKAVDKIISGMVAGLDTHSLQALCTHPIANPILQLSLQIELSRSAKARANGTGLLLQKLIPNESQEIYVENASFIKNLAYDVIGSRLLEVIISEVPQKLFNKIYIAVFKGKIGIFAKNEIAAFGVIKLLERLSQEELKIAAEDLFSQIELLIERAQTSVIKALIDCCRARDVGIEIICNGLQRAYGDDPVQQLVKMMKIEPGILQEFSQDQKFRSEKQDMSKVHSSLLAQSMLSTPGPLRQLIIDGFTGMDTDMLLFVAKDPAASRTLQSAIILPNQDPRFRRNILQRFYGHMTELAIDKTASFVIDKFWVASNELAYIREQMAIELLQNEKVLRDSYFGRIVWRNWSMDTYKTRRQEWIFNARIDDGPKKRGIDLARTRYVNSRKEIPRRAELSLSGPDMSTPKRGIWPKRPR